MKKIFLLFFVMLAGLFSATAQQQEYARIVIQEAYLDDQDVSEQYRQGEAFLIFYKNNDNEIYMANVWPKNDSQSYGRITDWAFNHYPETDDDFAIDEYQFNWHYSNTYDAESGVAKCCLLKFLDPEGARYALGFELIDNSTARYYGEMQGDIDKLITHFANAHTSPLSMPVSQNKPAFIGTWMSTTLQMLDDADNVIGTLNADAFDFSIKIEFMPNGRCLAYMEGEEVVELTYVYDAQKIYITEDGETLEFLYDNDKLFMLGVADDVKIKVIFTRL